MKRVALAGAFGLLLTFCGACANSDNEPGHADAGRQRPTRSDASIPLDQDAGTQPLDLHALLIAALIETERSLIARCPCQTANGVFKTMQECVDTVSLGRLWVGCANATDLTGFDDADLRANLRCNIEEVMQRSECLMGSACTDEAVAVCMSQSLGCNMLPLDVLSHVAVECSIAFSH